jgi:medium-chain acyl-[acyl-carrier-protein] hydrolase
MSPDPWIPWRPRKRGTGTRLFCFPYTGASASIFRLWPESLRPDIDVCPVELPGRGSRLREPPFSRLGPLVDALRDGLRAHLDVPFAFFGHSVGALVAFELARRLRREGAGEPVLLAVSGAAAPQLESHAPAVHDLAEPDLMDHLRRLRGTPTRVLEHGDLIRMMLPTIRADFALHETYRHVDEPPFTCPLVTFGGLDDASVPPHLIRPWRAQTRGPFSAYLLRGDHFFVHAAESRIVAILNQRLPAAATTAA